MKIGELASATGTPVESIRYYERELLLPRPARTAGNYRIYDATLKERLAFIRHCRSLDMTLEEIRTLLRFKDAPTDKCADVNALLDAHIGHVATRIAELKRLQTQLKDLRAQCVAAQGNDCGILEQLTNAAIRTPRAPRRESPHVAGTHGRAN